MNETFKQKLLRTKKLESTIADIEATEGAGEHKSLKRKLRQWDLVSFGIAAIIGAGIFTTIGKASAAGGPAVTLLFIFTAICCLFTALCYAEFAAATPVSGSAYAYAYVTFGELVAWIIGWALLMEYAIGNIAIAISWSDYFTAFVSSLKIELFSEVYQLEIPVYLTLDYLTAFREHEKASEAIAQGQALSTLASTTQDGYHAWQTAPSILGLRAIFDAPALVIVGLITYLAYIGISESRIASNLMVLFKLGIIIMVVIIGVGYIKPQNWSPFAPEGLTGILQGVAAVFFAYIGFDAISTTAEECINPQRDIPRATILALVICTVLYIIIALVLTGMVNYKNLNVGDPLAYVFELLDMNFVSGLVAFSAIVAMASVLLVYQLGQPRIWMSISRDGLLPPVFSKIHPKYRTPSFSTIVTGVLVAIPSLFMNLGSVVELSSIGTLFAFTVVSGGVLRLHYLKQKHKKVKQISHSNPTNSSEQNTQVIIKKRFEVPYINAKLYAPLLFVSITVLTLNYNSEACINLFQLSDPANPEYSKYEVLYHKFPFFLFILGSIILTYLAIVKNLSLIPLLGVVCCFYLMTELPVSNWTGFSMWLIGGLIIYFRYSIKHSKLSQTQPTN